MASSENRDYAADLAKQIIADLGEMGVHVTPTAYAIWHAHLGGGDSALSNAIKAQQAAGTVLTGAVLEELYENHILSSRNLRLAERSSRAS